MASRGRQSSLRLQYVLQDESNVLNLLKCLRALSSQSRMCPCRSFGRSDPNGQQRTEFCEIETRFTENRPICRGRRESESLIQIWTRSDPKDRPSRSRAILIHANCGELNSCAEKCIIYRVLRRVTLPREPGVNGVAKFKDEATQSNAWAIIAGRVGNLVLDVSLGRQGQIPRGSTNGTVISWELDAHSHVSGRPSSLHNSSRLGYGAPESPSMWKPDMVDTRSNRSASYLTPFESPTHRDQRREQGGLHCSQLPLGRSVP